MEKMRFGRVPAGIRAGDIIVWINRDVVRHTATALNGSFNIDLPGKATGRTVVRGAGLIPFYCKYHPAMKGQMTVSK